MPITIHHHLIDRLALLVAASSGFSLIPQVWKVYTDGPDGVALASFVIICLNSSVWLMYAIHRGLLSLAISSILNIITSGTIVTLVVRALLA